MTPQDRQAPLPQLMGGARPRKPMLMLAVGILLFLLLDIGFWALSALPLGRIDPAFVLFGRWWAIITLLFCIKHRPARWRTVVIGVSILASTAGLTLYMHLKGAMIGTYVPSWGTMVARQFFFTLILGMLLYALAEMLLWAVRWIMARWVRIGAGVVAALATGFMVPLFMHMALAKAYQDHAPEYPKSKRPITIMTALPLAFGDDTGDLAKIAGGQARPHPALARLAHKYRITMVDAITPQSIGLNGPLILIQPRVLQPEENVLIDEHARAGGQVMILADPDLQWEPLFPLGDKRNPPVQSMLSPVLDHWGISLPQDSGGVISVTSPAFDRYGAAVPQPSLEGMNACTMGGFVSVCQIGNGRATILTDADFLDTQNWAGPGPNGLNAAGWRGQSMASFEALLAMSTGRTQMEPLLMPVWNDGAAYALKGQGN